MLRLRSASASPGLLSDFGAYCGTIVLVSLAARHLRLLAIGIAAAIVLTACSPTADRPSPTQSIGVAVAPSASPIATGQPPPTGAPAPADDLGPNGDSVTGDSVTGGEPGASATAEVALPTASPTAGTAPPPKPSPKATPNAAAAEAEPFAMNLYRKGDFVAQYTFEWCVGASLQMALNMATTRSHTSRADQQQLWEMARDRSFSPFGGANPIGWTAVLNELGVGPYELVSIPTLDEALTTAAKAIRATKRPVGLVMWRGRHAWVMSGFESTADPRFSDDFDVSGIRVLDPLYPHGSSRWGQSPKPNSLVSRATLGKQFVVRDGTRSRVNLGVPSGYLMIVPVDA
jgi:hypothetical protein